MLTIIAKEIFVRDCIGLEMLDKDCYNMQICLPSDTNQMKGLDADSHYRKCGFNFIKENICGCNAPPFNKIITLCFRKTYALCKATILLLRMDLHRDGLPLSLCLFQLQRLENRCIFSFV